jgi:hypothetical protein
MKIVSVSENDYKVRVRDGGTITLFTGTQTGTVIVSGDLLVQGNTTTVESETMTVKDNIIILNQGETGAGVTLGTSGIQIDRGPSTPDAQLVWDENETHYSPTTGGTPFGTWVFKRDNGTLTGIQTNSIDTNQGILGLINSGSTGYVTVTGTANYERNVLSYVDNVTFNPTLGVSLNPTDDDIIPNSKAMADYVSGSLAFFVAETFGAGDTLGEGFDTVRFTGVASFNGFIMTIVSVTTGKVKVGQRITGAGITPGTTITAFGGGAGPAGAGGIGTYTVSNSHSLLPTAITVGDAVSKLTFKVDNVLEATIDSTGLTVGNINVDVNTISSTSNNIILDPNNSNVQIEGHVSLVNQVSDPTAAASLNKVYSKSALGAGDTGLYFTNTTESGELVSKKRAILFGMIF